MVTTIDPIHNIDWTALGPLHDQMLSDIILKDNELRLVFDIELYADDFTDPGVYEKYKDYHTCTLTIAIRDARDCYGDFFGAIRQDGTFDGCYMGLSAAVDVLQKRQMAEFLSLSVGDPETVIHMGVDFDHRPLVSWHVPRRIRKSCSMDICLIASSITCEWQ